MDTGMNWKLLKSPLLFRHGKESHGVFREADFFAKTEHGYVSTVFSLSSCSYSNGLLSVDNLSTRIKHNMLSFFRGQLGGGNNNDQNSPNEELRLVLVAATENDHQADTIDIEFQVRDNVSIHNASTRKEQCLLHRLQQWVGISNIKVDVCLHLSLDEPPLYNVTSLSWNAAKTAFTANLKIPRCEWFYSSSYVRSIQLFTTVNIDFNQFATQKLKKTAAEFRSTDLLIEDDNQVCLPVHTSRIIVYSSVLRNLALQMYPTRELPRSAEFHEVMTKRIHIRDFSSAAIIGMVDFMYNGSAVIATYCSGVMSELLELGYVFDISGLVNEIVAVILQKETEWFHPNALLAIFLYASRRTHSIFVRLVSKCRHILRQMHCQEHLFDESALYIELVSLTRVLGFGSHLKQPLNSNCEKEPLIENLSLKELTWILQFLFDCCVSLFENNFEFATKLISFIDAKKIPYSDVLEIDSVIRLFRNAINSEYATASFIASRLAAKCVSWFNANQSLLIMRSNQYRLLQAEDPRSFSELNILELKGFDGL